MAKPDLRIIHNMARSGSTLISKCLGCMEHVALLSEVHPHARGQLNPLVQAQKWFELLTPDDLAHLKLQNPVDYEAVIGMIELRCRERGERLVLRDWSHLDYTGYPYRTPSYKPLLVMKLADHFNIINLSITRDPVTQWLSLIRVPKIQATLQSGKFDLEQFLLGYRKYAELCVETGFIRYEDFVREPEKTMRQFCDLLQVNFDPNFINKWYNYKTITGDIVSTRGGNEIKPVPMRPLEPVLKQQFIANADYQRSIELLGYAQVI